jgi:hypothetical protein
MQRSGWASPRLLDPVGNLAFDSKARLQKLLKPYVLYRGTISGGCGKVMFGINARLQRLLKTHALYQGTTLEAAENLTRVPKRRLNLAQDVILGSRMEDE